MKDSEQVKAPTAKFINQFSTITELSMFAENGFYFVAEAFDTGGGWDPDWGPLETVTYYQAQVFIPVKKNPWNGRLDSPWPSRNDGSEKWYLIYSDGEWKGKDGPWRKELVDLMKKTKADYLRRDRELTASLKKSRDAWEKKEKARLAKREKNIGKNWEKNKAA